MFIATRPITEEKAKLVKKYIQNMAWSGTEVTIEGGKIPYEEKPEYSIGAIDVVIDSPDVLEQVQKAEKEGYDAVVINCFYEHGLDAARELVKIPIIGPGVSSVLLASLLGHRISLVCVGTVSFNLKSFDDRSVDFYLFPHFREINLDSKLVSCRGIRIDQYFIRAILERPPQQIEIEKKALIAASKKALTEDKADVLALGCTGLTGMAREVQKELGIPVVDPLLTALKFAEALVDLKLTHSKTSKYRKLPEKEYVL